ncbi:CoA ester lyase [Amycolatopsis sp.]|uniref:HpcH/HpaI aldolase/citrate lyase family protein n=1 Tax=Amycolatopsis sp. TaxID=37632 RepID=UPI002BC4F2ED|nr:CoA ester lyase [Amycolatopsis sp.]HVV09483.1 CoA ester lyase [Amycolatopsis sp.]
MIGRARSWLYVPAHRPELLVKAMAGPADAVVYDLEDAVAPRDKDIARDNAVAAVGASWPKPLWVRINAPETPWGDQDVAELGGRGAAGFRVPKSADPEVVAKLADRLEAPLHLLVESALGVENAFRLATRHSLIASVSLGEADLLADLRVRDTTALEWARQRVVNANRAAGLPSPPHAVWTDVADVDGLIADTGTARDRGFFGRSVVHPAQVAPVNQIFSPSETEIADAERLLDSVHEQGSAAWLDERGRFVDPAVVARSRWVLELATQFETGRTDV